MTRISRPCLPWEAVRVRNHLNPSLRWIQQVPVPFQLGLLHYKPMFRVEGRSDTVAQALFEIES